MNLNIHTCNISQYLIYITLPNTTLANTLSCTLNLVLNNYRYTMSSVLTLKWSVLLGGEFAILLTLADTLAPC